MNIPVFCSFIRRKDMDTVLNCLVTDSVGPGEYLERFHKNSKEILGYDYGFALRSPYFALGTALDSLNLKEGECVAMSALAPPYYASVVASRKLSILYVDTEIDSPTPTAECVAKAIAEAPLKPKAYVHYEALGVMTDPHALRELGIPIIEDASQSLGGYIGEVRAGAVGQLSFAALESGCIITAGGGALVFTHGRRDAQVLRNQTEDIPSELRMTDYNAALGMAQVKELETIIGKRREMYSIFAQSITRTRHRLISQAGDGEPGFWAFPIALSSGMKDVRAYAKKKEIDTEPAFDNSLLGKGFVPEGSCPNARSLLLRALLFPLHQRIGAAGAQKLARVLATLP